MSDTTADALCSLECCCCCCVGELWGGAPARFIRKLTHDEKDALKLEAVEINRLAWAVRKGE